MYSTKQVLWLTHTRSGGDKISAPLPVTVLTPVASTRMVAIVLHGGSSNSLRLRWFGELLAEQGFRVIMFDHEASGTVSLDRRLSEATSIARKTLRPHDQLTVVGFSMGGFTAIELAHNLPDRVASLVLVAPAAYGDHTRRAAFGPDFRALISAPASWHEASCFGKLQALRLPTILAIPSDDKVIPRGITERYEAVVRSLPLGQVCVFPRAAHGVDLWLRTDTAAAAEFAHDIWRSAQSG